MTTSAPRLLVTLLAGLGMPLFFASPASTATWARYYHDVSRRSGAIDGDTVIATRDGGIVLAIAVPTTPPPLLLRDVWLVKADVAGAIAWRRVLGGPEDEAVASLVEAANGDLLLAGERTGPSLDRRAWLARTDSLGNLLWSRSYGSAGSPSCRHAFRFAREAPTGEVVVAGAATCASEPDHGLAMRFDGNGNILWWRVLSDASFLTGAVPLPDGSLIFTGINDLPSDAPRALAIQFDPSGTLRWAREYTRWTSDPGIGEHDALTRPLPGGGFLMAVNSRNSMFAPVSSTLLRLDEDGALVLATTFDGSVPGAGLHLAVGDVPASGGYVASGSLDSGLALLVRLDDAGALAWARAYSPGPLDSVTTSLALAADGGFLVPVSDATTPDRAVLLKTDALGLLDSCAFDGDAALSPIPVAWAVIDVPIAFLNRPPVAAADTVPEAPSDLLADDLCGTSCAATSLAVTGLLLTRAGDDARLQWDPASSAAGYNAWTVALKGDIDRARITGIPPAVGVAGCSSPASATSTSCVDAGAVSRGSPGTRFYQLRVACDAASEGP